MNRTSQAPTRRAFLAQSASCGAYVAGIAACAPAVASRVYAQSAGDVITTEKWGRIEKVTDGIWALVSDFSNGDFTTVSNGGIIAGDQGVLVVEALNTAAGAKWFAEWAQRLTGKWPTDVVVTHYHGDHSAGDAGYEKDTGRPRLWVTEKTRELVTGSRARNEAPAELENVSLLPAGRLHTIDLGNRKVNVVPRSGHTLSDVCVEVQDPNVVFAGDLFFNRMVPNYRDSLPRRLSEQVAEIARETGAKFVPGHGPLASRDDLSLYLEFLGVMEQAARRAFEAGQSSAEASERFELPERFKDWHIFAPTVMPNAFAAWYRQFEQDGSGDG